METLPAPKWELIDSVTAGIYMTRNVCNRPMVARHVDAYAKELIDGKFIRNGDSVRFDVENNLIDGQHRLQACIKTGIPFWAVVIRGLPTDAFQTIDRGRRRMISDALAIQGEKNCTTLGAAMTYQWRIETGISPYSMSSDAIPNIESNLAVLERNPELRKSVDHVKKVAGLSSPAMAAFLHYQFSRYRELEADAFFDRLRDGIGLTGEEPVYLLRERLAQNNTGKAKLPVKEVMALVIKAWNYTVQNKSIKRLRWANSENKEESFPEPYGGWYKGR